MTFILYKIVIYIIDNEKLEKEIFVQTIYKKKIYKNLIKEYNVYQTSLFKYFILSNKRKAFTNKSKFTLFTIQVKNYIYSIQNILSHNLS